MHGLLASPSLRAPLPGAPTRVLLVDDSLVSRAIVSRILDDAGGFTVAASCARATDALDFLGGASVDLILLDLDMPGMGGLDALPLLIERARGARVLVFSANCPRGGAIERRALALGATETLEKPGKGGFAGPFSRLLVTRLRALAGAPVARVHVAVERPPPRRRAPPSIDPRTIDAIGIGGSTGGIVAIRTLLASIPESVDAPIFITQHLPASFMPYFATQLASAAGREVLLAKNGVEVARGAIYLAPGEAHLAIERVGTRAIIHLDQTRSPTGVVPSVDTMFASLARSYGAACLCVILSGMGRDGSVGAGAVRHAGGLVVAQCQSSSVVWGMPGSVVRAGLAHAVQSPAAVGATIGRIAT